jgi:uncharacterized membrane protein
MTGSNYLTLWLNYENKIEDIRSRFLIIAGLLFTLQSGIFALMLDKILLNEKFRDKSLLWRAFLVEIILIALSILIHRLFNIISESYTRHIDTNIQRSKFVVNKSVEPHKYESIKEFKEDINKHLAIHYHPQNHDPKDPIKQTRKIYLTLFLATIGVPILHIIILTCTDLI